MDLFPGIAVFAFDLRMLAGYILKSLLPHRQQLLLAGKGFALSKPLLLKHILEPPKKKSFEKKKKKKV